MTGHSTISLNGSWQIRPGGPDPSAPFGREPTLVPVPGLVDLAIPAYDWQGSDYHWYSTSFALDAGQQALPLAMLVIEQAMFGTRVWLNGSPLGGDICCYTSQEYNLSSSLVREGRNELVVRVGARHTLPPESAVGKDQERKAFIPGIWGDVRIECSGIPRVERIQILPDIRAGSARTDITVQNPSGQALQFTYLARIRERATGTLRGELPPYESGIPPYTSLKLSVDIPIAEPRLWSPDDPFLYRCEVELRSDGALTDGAGATFGLRSFRVEGNRFFLNDRPILLRGGNIAFHRFLSDDQRGALPWDLEWVRKVLIDIPRAHNFNFFRNHIGQMYNRWYDIADEHGMLLQNEWQFWTTSGTREQISWEFTRWVEDNANHPSIVIWDPLNESTDTVVQTEIVPRMKELDPTRPWESVDFHEEHPYIYSLGPVLPEGRFGFCRPFGELLAPATPTMLNEFVWWWLDRDGNPTSLMDGVVERWLGPDSSPARLLAHQAFLARELVELFRRMDIRAIQPFVYLSNNNGATAHWFLGNIKDLVPKPILGALREAFAPLGLSLELWDRHFFPEERRRMRLFLFNDLPQEESCTVTFGVVDPSGSWVHRKSLVSRLDPSSMKTSDIAIDFPRAPGPFTVTAELFAGRPWRLLARSRKPAFVIDPPAPAPALPPVALFDGDREILDFLASKEVPVRSLALAGTVSLPERCRLAVIPEGKSAELARSPARTPLGRFVADGGTLLLLEPEFDPDGERGARYVIQLFDDLALQIEWREDPDRGGYDSVVSPADAAHAVWSGILPAHLQLLNGGFGGIMVPQCDVTPSRPFSVHGSCGLCLKGAALIEVPYGGGRVVVSRIQLRGRLVEGSAAPSFFNMRPSLGMPYRNGWWDRFPGLFAPRPDPVAQRYLMNLLTAFN